MKARLIALLSEAANWRGGLAARDSELCLANQARVNEHAAQQHVTQI